MHHLVRLSTFLLISLLCAVHTEVAGQRMNLLLESTFENGNYLAGWNNFQHCCDHSVQQSTEKIKAGSQALRIEVRKSDPLVSGSIRSEITQDSDPLNQDRWYGFSFLLKDWVDDDATESVFQWHPENDTGTATMGMWASGGRFTYITNKGLPNTSNEYVDLGPVQSNKWVDMVIRVRWATDTTGLLQVWLQGNLVISRFGVRTTTDASYFKLGTNKFGWLTQEASTVAKRVIYYDEVRIGNANATYNDVAPFLPKRDYFQGR